MPDDAENPGPLVLRLDAGRIEHLEALYSAVYGHQPPKDYFRKKYTTAYTGSEYAGYIAYNGDGIPIAYYGVIPCYLKYGDSVVLAAQSADTMTHPGFRYKGLFVELSNRCFELCRNEGIRILFGFPNQHSYHGAIHKLGWTMTETMDCFIIPVSALSLEKLAARFPFLKGVYRRYVRSVLGKSRKAAQEIQNSVIADGFAGVFRDHCYFQYKDYYERFFIRCGQSGLWIRINNGLVIGDIELSGDDFDLLVKKIQRLARVLGLRQIQFHSSPGTRLHELFRARYAPAPSFPVLFQDFGSGLPLDKIKFTFGDIDIF
jgi:GNAT superfamily N-acetyltransferase